MCRCVDVHQLKKNNSPDEFFHILEGMFHLRHFYATFTIPTYIKIQTYKEIQTYMKIHVTCYSSLFLLFSLRLFLLSSSLLCSLCHSIIVLLIIIIFFFHFFPFSSSFTARVRRFSHKNRVRCFTCMVDQLLLKPEFCYTWSLVNMLCTKDSLYICKCFELGCSEMGVLVVEIFNFKSVFLLSFWRS